MAQTENPNMLFDGAWFDMCLLVQGVSESFLLD